jgi:1A family penicillin-binding protein
LVTERAPTLQQELGAPEDRSTAKPETSIAAPSRIAEPAIVKTLTAPVLLKLLERRLVISTRRQGERIQRRFLRLRGRLRARTRSWSAAAANVAAAEPGSRLHRQMAALSRVRWRDWHLPKLHQGRLLKLIACAALAPAAYIAYCIATIPLADSPSAPPSSGAMVLVSDNNHAVTTRGIFKGEKISADQVPVNLANAVVAIEDRRFYQHDGIDLRATTRAVWHDLIGRKLEGGSTITQQLARRLYLSPERTLKRKVQEAALAVWLELRLSKKEILARYLNTAYFGDGAYGVDAAAKSYFGKDAQDLSLTEAAMLAGLLKAPSGLAPNRNFAGAQQRADIVLDAMVQNGAVSQQQANAARQQPAVLRPPPEAPPGSNYFVDAVAAEVKSLIGPSTEDLTIRPTLDPEMQQIAERVIANRLATAGKAGNVGQAALIAMAPDGAILAMVGGRDYNESQFNRATQARRQPGSLFKVFVYLAALRQGLTPDSMVVDQPVSVGDWEPDNYGDRYYGPVTLRTAFAHSLNSVAVQLAQTVDIKTVIDTARQLGVRSDLPVVPSVTLGSGNVTLLEMTRAFANIAQNATAVDAYVVREITKGNQRVYVRPAAPATQADTPSVHAQMLDLLSSVVLQGTGRAARIDRPVGGKTGTSQDYHDAWFVGFTSNLIVGVWVGNDDNTPMNNVTGGSLPATIWHDFVAGAEVGRAPQAVSASIFNDGSAIPATARSPTRHQWQNPFRLFGFRF